MRETMKARQKCAEYYNHILKQLDTLIQLPIVKDGKTSVWAQYSLLAMSKEMRDFLVKFLRENSINVAIFYPVPLHYQECFSSLNYKKGLLPKTNIYLLNAWTGRQDALLAQPSGLTLMGSIFEETHCHSGLKYTLF